MKINQDIRANVEGPIKNTGKIPQGNRTFGTMIQTQTQQLQQNQLDRLVETITAQGERVARSRSFRDLAKYKRLIKDFIKESVQYGTNLKPSQHWSPNGQTRRLTLIETIDERLLELTEMVMDQEKRSVDLLGLMGEMKGLLINLYT
ncbi:MULTISPECIES: YaaR family protein [Halobacillus]|uniref:YaaR family protein n=1 Tax=Halobacillus TaxID=45667 RepID=UPI00040A1848|nr:MULTISPECIES: YaaR family protein [Halobacillus]